MPSYHDALFKQVFAQPSLAADELRHVLPPELSELIDWSSLRVQPGSFVDDELSSQHADLLYSVSLRQRAAFVYFLCEHKSEAPKTVALQFLRYLTRIWEEFQRTHPPGTPLPPILVVLVCHGARPWPGGDRFLDIVDAPADVRALLESAHLDFRIIIDDLAVVGVAELRARTMSALGRLTLLALKRALQTGDFLGELREWSEVVLEAALAPGAREALAGWIWYIMKTQNLSFLEAVERLAEEAGLEMPRATPQEALLGGTAKARRRGARTRDGERDEDTDRLHARGLPAAGPGGGPNGGRTSRAAGRTAASCSSGRRS